MRKVCQFCGAPANRTYNGRGICNRHRYQIRKYGHTILGRNEPNIYIDRGEYYEIELWSKGEKLDKYGIIDKDDYEKVKNIRWHLEKSKNGLEYLASCKDRKTVRMHNIILGKDHIVDHKNGNGLDNRKNNLRYVTVNQNSMNSKHTMKTYSGVKGITYDKKTKKWIAYIAQEVALRKHFENLEDAVIYRKKMENEIFGEYNRSHEWKNEHIYINGIKEFSDCDGEDFRTVIYISGCWWNCPKCHNPQTHDIKNGKKIKIGELINIINNIDNDNVTISGGDGLTFQIRETYELVKELKLYHNKNIWLYTGYTFEDLLTDKDPIRQEILKYIDTLVDGKFNYQNHLKNPNPLFRGDDSQRLINVQQTLKQMKIVLYSD